MSDAVNLVAEAELSNGLLAVVEDSLNKDVFHVYKEAKNVQPNHDAKGIMRYLMTVIHALGYKSDKAERELEEKTSRVKALEARVELLEEMLIGFSTDGPDVNLMTHAKGWQVLLTLDGRNLYKKGLGSLWQPAKNIREILDNIYKEQQ